MPGCFRPRPLSSATRLERLLLALEVPECGCKVRVRWERRRLGVTLSPGGQPQEVFRRLPVFGYQLKKKRGQPRAAPVFGQPCPHAILADHTMDYDRWAQLLALAAIVRQDEDGYAEPPPDPRPKCDPRTASELLYEPARVALYAQRARRGFALFHVADWHHTLMEGAAVQGEKGLRQGEMVHEQDHALDDPDEAALEELADLWAWARASRPGRNQCTS